MEKKRKKKYRELMLVMPQNRILVFFYLSNFAFKFQSRMVEESVMVIYRRSEIALRIESSLEIRGEFSKILRSPMPPSHANRSLSSSVKDSEFATYWMAKSMG